MDLREVVKQRKLLLEAGVIEKLSVLPQKDALDVLLKAEKYAEEKNLFVITNELVSSFLAQRTEEQKASQAHVEIAKTQPTRAETKERDEFIPQLRILSNKKFDCTGKIEDFIVHFRNRLEKLGGLLKNRAGSNGVSSIEQVKSSLDRRQSRIVGIVDNKSITKKGNIRFELEDETGVMTCIATQSKPAATAKAQEIWLDDVIAVDGQYTQGLFIVENVLWPEVPLRQKKLGDVDKDVSIAFVSDIHAGSRYFLQENFERALGFFNGAGSEEEQKLSKTIKYLIIAGDLVDGVGVYPSQEKQLVTKNIYEQYELLAEYIKKIPGHIQIIISPGNHDAVRDAEPQPPLPSEFVHSLEGENVFFVPNPCLLDIHGVKILVYHGTSFDALISNTKNPDEAFEHPERIAVEMLKRRHLSPIYGEKPIIPSREDGMVIEIAPDIFHFGHVHKNALFDYNGTLIVNSGTWQGETDYMKKMGRKPSPCLMPIYNLRTGVVKILDFNDKE